MGRTDGESDVFTSRTSNIYSQAGMLTTDRESVASQHDSLSSQLHDMEELEEEAEEEEEDWEGYGLRPLFVYLMCSVRCGKLMKSVPVHNLPTCLSKFSLVSVKV